MLTTYIMSDIGFLVHHHSGLIRPFSLNSLMLLLGLEPRLTESKPDVMTPTLKELDGFFSAPHSAVRGMRDLQ